MWRCSICWIALGNVAIWLSSAPASADILIESYREARPADADQVLAPLRDALARVGVEVRPDSVISVAGEQLPLSGVAGAAVEPSYPGDPRGQVELGARQVLRGDYDAGLATLDGVVKAARANPGLVAADAAARAWLTKAYAAIAFAQLRTRHQAAATDAVAEQIRSFPDAPIGRLVGPEVETLAQSVRTALDGTARGNLRITVSRSDVQVFLNEQPRGGSGAAVSLIPGSYRVLLRRGGVARRYGAVVAPGRLTRLDVDWDADAAFTATARWIGFVWPRGEEDRTDAAVARHARAGRLHDVIVVGIDASGGRRVIVGAMFEKRTGALVRRKAIELGRDDAVCVRALAHYLMKGDLSPCLRDAEHGRPPAVATGPARAATTSVPGRTTGVVVAQGLLHTDEPDRPSRGLPIVLAVGGAALAVTGAVLVTIDEDPEFGTKKSIRNTGPAGAALVVTGAVAMLGGLAVYRRWFAPPGAASSVTAAITSDTAYLGWAGRF